MDVNTRAGREKKKRNKTKTTKAAAILTNGVVGKQTDARHRLEHPVEHPVEHHWTEEKKENKGGVHLVRRGSQ